MTSRSRPIVNISNIVTLSRLCSPFDLTLLKQSIPFDSSKYPFSRIPIIRGKTKFSIFNTGSVVSRASSSIPEFERNLRLLHDCLTQFGLEPDLEYTITNIVAYSRLNLPELNLLVLSKYLPSSSYDPSSLKFGYGRPGCNVIVHSLTKRKPRKTILIFSSSAITLTGFRLISDLENETYKFKRELTDIIERHPRVKKK